LENRLHHLSLLQRQAEEDAQVAQKLQHKYQRAAQEENLHEHKLPDDILVSRCEDESLLGASSCLPSTSNYKPVKNQEPNEEFEDEEDLRQLQEKQDAVS
jgi:hypothetical protein